jgi:hypothetical protein
MRRAAPMVTEGFWAGFIGDSLCGAKHKAASAADATRATTGLKGGDKAVLVTSEGKVYTIDDAGQKKVASFAGKTATITGDVSGDSIKVASIK